MKYINSKVDEISATINRFLDNIDETVGWFLKVLIIFMTFLIAMQTFCRFILNFSFSWVPEILRFCSAWLVCVGASISVRFNEHIGFVFLRQRLNKRGKQILVLIANSIIIIFLVWTVIQGLEYAISKMDVLSSTMRIPMFYPYMALPIGLTVISIYYVLTSLLVFLGTSEY